MVYDRNVAERVAGPARKRVAHRDGVIGVIDELCSGGCLGEKKRPGRRRYRYYAAVVGLEEPAKLLS